MEVCGSCIPPLSVQTKDTKKGGGKYLIAKMIFGRRSISDICTIIAITQQTPGGVKKTHLKESAEIPKTPPLFFLPPLGVCCVTVLSLL